jgi:hypothetical protein
MSYKYSYTGSGPWLYLGDLARAVEIAIPNNHFIANASGVIADFIFDDQLTTEEETILSSCVTSHSETVLANEKTRRTVEVDRRTDEIILRGFSYDGKTFEMDESARANFQSLHYFVKQGFIPLPTAVNTVDDQIYYVTSSGQLDQLVGSGLQTYYGVLQGGWALKLQMRACTTLEQLYAIVDTRA